MSGAIRALNEKISNIELVQENFQNENLQNEKVTAKGSKLILGGVLMIMSIVILGYFGGIDPGSLGKGFDLSASQLAADIADQNAFINKNLNTCLQSVDFMNKSIVAEIGTKTDFICAKLEVITKAFINKDINLNSIFGNLPSDRGKDWE